MSVKFVRYFIVMVLWLLPAIAFDRIGAVINGEASVWWLVLVFGINIAFLALLALYASLSVQEALEGTA